MYMYYIRSTFGIRAAVQQLLHAGAGLARLPCEIFSRHSNTLFMYSSATMFMLDSIGVYGGDMGKLNCIYIILYEYVILANAISLFYNCHRRHYCRTA